MIDSKDNSPGWMGTPLKGHKRSAALVFVIAFALFCVTMFLIAFQQGRSVSAAGEHASKLRSVLLAEPAFSALSIYSQSGPVGAVHIRGTLPSEFELHEMKELVINSSSPVPIRAWIKLADVSPTNESHNEVFWKIAGTRYGKKE